MFVTVTTVTVLPRVRPQQHSLLTAVLVTQQHLSTRLTYVAESYRPGPQGGFAGTQHSAGSVADGSVPAHTLGSIRLAVHLLVCLSVRPVGIPSFQPAISPSARKSVRLSVHTSVCSFIRLFVRPSVCPSIRLFVRPYIAFRRMPDRLPANFLTV